MHDDQRKQLAALVEQARQDLFRIGRALIDDESVKVSNLLGELKIRLPWVIHDHQRLRSTGINRIKGKRQFCIQTLRPSVPSSASSACKLEQRGKLMGNQGVVAALGMIGVLFSNVVFGQALWNGTQYGMTVAQVKAAVPEAQHPTSNPGTLMAGGRKAEELLRVDGIEIANRRFQAAFFFADNKLTQTTLSAPRSMSNYEASLVYDNLLTTLRAKYGREVNTKTSEGMLATRETQWVVERTNIGLFMMTMDGTPPILNINYQVRVAADADKL